MSRKKVETLAEIDQAMEELKVKKEQLLASTRSRTFATLKDAAEELRDLVPCLQDEKLETLAPKLGQLAHYGLPQLNGKITTAGLEDFALNGLTVHITADLLKSEWQAQRAIKQVSDRGVKGSFTAVITPTSGKVV